MKWSLRRWVCTYEPFGWFSTPFGFRHANPVFTARALCTLHSRKRALSLLSRTRLDTPELRTSRGGDSRCGSPCARRCWPSAHGQALSGLDLVLTDWSSVLHNTISILRIASSYERVCLLPAAARRHSPLCVCVARPCASAQRTRTHMRLWTASHAERHLLRRLPR